MTDQQLDMLVTQLSDSSFVVRKSARARHMAISVAPGGLVEVVVPRNARPQAIEYFVSQHRQWIDRALGEMAQRHPPVDRSMPASFSLAALAEDWSVQYRASRFATVGASIHLPVARRDAASCRRYLHRWLKDRAKAGLVPRLEELARANGFQYRRVQVRGQRTRWGSYSSSGTLSINFSLLFLPPELVRHLMLHELCHTVEMNHSRRFWKLLSRYQPEFRDLERRLDKAWTHVPGWVGLH